MRIVVTGANGFIGSNIVRFLKNRDYSVMELGNDYWYEENERTLAKLSRNIWNFSPHWIVHMAANSNTQYNNEDMIVSNESQTRFYVNLAYQLNSGFIFASSASVYGNVAVCNENGVLNPRTLYAKTKVNSEKNITNVYKNRSNYYILRLFNVCGFPVNGATKDVAMSCPVSRYIRSMDIGEKYYYVYHDEEGKMIYRDFVFVRDVCNVIKWIVDGNAKSNVYNVGSGVYCSFDELALIIRNVLVKEYGALKVPVISAKRKKFPVGYQVFTQSLNDNLKRDGYPNYIANIFDMNDFDMVMHYMHGE